MSGALLTLEEAVARLVEQAAARAPLGTRTVALEAADGCVLAEPLFAGLDLPPWPNSAMDGYALRVADCGEVGAALPISQRILAGMQPAPLESGTCARIFTGAPLPEGADTVEMQENTEPLPDGRVRFLEPLRQGRHVRPLGDEARRGELILEAGTRLEPIHLALAASLGNAELVVARPPRVALLSTGDELVEPGLPLAPGQIYNSNRSLLAHWVRRLGGEVLDMGILPDDPQRIRALLGALQDVDLILSSGGVSVGEADFLGQILQEAGELTFWKLAIKPGKPLTCGHYHGIPVIGLPGNPVSTLVTFGLLARPWLLRIQGATDVEPWTVNVPAGFAWPRPGTRREFLRARLEQGRAILHPNQSSAVLRSAAWAEGLVELREGVPLAEGDPVRFIPFASLYA